MRSFEMVVKFYNGVIFTVQRYASAVYAMVMCSSISLKQASVLSKQPGITMQTTHCGSIDR